jgi:hypothetical protein
MEELQARSLGQYGRASSEVIRTIWKSFRLRRSALNDLDVSTIIRGNNK